MEQDNLYSHAEIAKNAATPTEIQVHAQPGESLSVYSQKEGARAVLKFFNQTLDFNEIPPFFLSNFQTRQRSDTEDKILRVNLGSSSRGRRVYISFNSKMRDVSLSGGLLVAIPGEKMSLRFLDIFEVNESAVNLTNRLNSFRIDESENKLINNGWNGIEHEIFSRFFLGEIDIPVNELPDLKSTLNDSGSITIGNFGRQGQHFRVRHPLCTPGDEVTIKFREDKTRGYIWLEIYKRTNNGTDVFVATNRIDRARKKLPRWKGHRTQSIIDWTEGSLPTSLAHEIRIDFSNRNHYTILISSGHEIRIDKRDIHRYGFEQIHLKPTEIYGQKQFDVFGVKQDGTLTTNPIAMYRIILHRGKLRLYKSRLPSKSSYVNYFFGLNDMIFSDLEPIRLVTPANGESVSLATNPTVKGKNITFYLNPGEAISNEELLFVPRQDRSGTIKWFDVFKFDPSTKTPEHHPFASAKVNGSKLERRNWRGLEIELLKEYAKRQVDFEDLQPISITFGESPVISLWKSEGKKIYLALSQLFGFKKGDKLNIRPEKEIDQDRALFQIFREGDNRPLGLYEYDRTKQKFYLVRVYENSDQQINTSTEDHSKMKRWQFSQVPWGYWTENDKENVQIATKWLVEEILGYSPNEPDFRGNVMQVKLDDFTKNGLHGIFTVTKLKLYEVLQLAYPELDITVRKMIEICPDRRRSYNRYLPEEQPISPEEADAYLEGLLRK